MIHLLSVMCIIILKNTLLVQNFYKYLDAASSFNQETYTNINQLIISDAKKEIEINTSHLNKLKLLSDEYNSDFKLVENSIKSVRSAENLILDDECKEACLIANSEESQHQLELEIDNLGLEIDLKKRLINELETNNKNLEKMKNFYENKLFMLQNRIRLIEEEREKMIANASENEGTKYEEHVKKIRLEYELKLEQLQSEVLKYQRIKAKNAEMIKNALENEKQLHQLNKEVLDMKRLKVKLMNQLKDETLRFKKEEQTRIREIATLKRDHLKKDNQIKFLEAEKRCKEIVLKRKQEQLQALRRNTTRLSDKASGKHIPQQPNAAVKGNGSIGTKISNSPDLTSIFKKKSLFSKTFQIKWQKLDEIVIFLLN